MRAYIRKRLDPLHYILDAVEAEEWFDLNDSFYCDMDPDTCECYEHTELREPHWWPSVFDKRCWVPQKSSPEPALLEESWKAEV